MPFRRRRMARMRNHASGRLKSRSTANQSGGGITFLMILCSRPRRATGKPTLRALRWGPSSHEGYPQTCSKPEYSPAAAGATNLGDLNGDQHLQRKQWHEE